VWACIRPDSSARNAALKKAIAAVLSSSDDQRIGVSRRSSSSYMRAARLRSMASHHDVGRRTLDGAAEAEAAAGIVMGAT
jgi:hypothetical protein